MSTREHEYACFKRCYDNYNADPKFRTLMEESPDTAVRKLGYEGLLDCNILPEAIQYISFGRKRAGSMFRTFGRLNGTRMYGNYHYFFYQIFLITNFKRL